MAPCLGDEFRAAEQIAAALSLSSNLVLVLLILLKSTRELRVYSRMLLCNVFIELMFTASSFIVELVRTSVYWSHIRRLARRLPWRDCIRNCEWICSRVAFCANLPHRRARVLPLPHRAGGYHSSGLPLLCDMPVRMRPCPL